MADYGKEKEKKKPPNPLLIPPKKGESHSKMFDGVMKYWCGRRGCRKWTDHPTSEHPPHLGDGNNTQSANTATSQQETEATSSDRQPTPGSEQGGLPTSITQSGSDSVSAYSASLFHFT